MTFILSQTARKDLELLNFWNLQLIAVATVHDQSYRSPTEVLQTSKNWRAQWRDTMSSLGGTPDAYQVNTNCNRKLNHPSIAGNTNDDWFQFLGDAIGDLLDYINTSNFRLSTRPSLFLPLSAPSLWLPNPPTSQASVRREFPAQPHLSIQRDSHRVQVTRVIPPLLFTDPPP